MASNIVPNGDDFGFSIDQAMEILSQQSSNEFCVDFDYLWVWVGYSTKGNAKRVLESNFVEGEDFRFIRNDKFDNHARFSLQELAALSRLEQIMLTPDTAKEFAMLAGTKQGKMVRRYFIEAEKQLRQSKTKGDRLVEMAIAYRDHEQKIEEHERIIREHQAQLLQAQEDRIRQLEMIIATSQATAQLQADVSTVNDSLHTLEVNQDETRLKLQETNSEVNRYRHGRMEQDQDGDMFSIKGWAALHKVRLGKTKSESQVNASRLGKAATRYCKQFSLGKAETFDPDYGAVGVYPQTALIYAFSSILNVNTTGAKGGDLI